MNAKSIISIALFGSLWGLVEATMGGALHFLRVPFTGTIMASFGFAILFAALRSGVKPASLIGVGLVAASFKFLDPLLFPIPFFDIVVVNPAVAIASQGLAFAAVFSRAPDARRIGGLAPRFLAAAAIGMIAFNLVSIVVFGWQTNHTQHPFNAVFVQLPLMAIGATLLSWALLLFGDRVPISLAPRWRAAAAAACILMAVATRFVIR